MMNDTIVVTGASAGAGRAIAVRFARNGCRIGLIARGLKGLSEAKREVEENGGTALCLQADVSDYNAVEAAAEKIESELGPISIWINNAMTTVFAPINKISPEDFRRVTEVTYLGFVYGTMAALRRMRQRNRGTIVQVGSALAYRGIPLQSAYCGAKHAIQGFNESVRSELIHDNLNIHLTMVQMPALNTPQFSWCKSAFSKKPQPVPPIYQPEVAAEAVYFAAYHKRREVNVGFSNVILLIGNKFFPGFGDKYLAKNGYDSQLTSEDADKNRKSNLYEALDNEKDFGSHGRFDSRAKNKSMQLRLNFYKKFWYMLFMIVLLVVIILLI